MSSNLDSSREVIGASAERFTSEVNFGLGSRTPNVRRVDFDGAVDAGVTVMTAMLGIHSVSSRMESAARLLGIATVSSRMNNPPSSGGASENFNGLRDSARR